ncbi:MAG: hypothetical protein K2X87_00555 [Gemmataceae bacterium]|nr:hypothetical protein [Gemmataceae bacterium]
MAVRPTVRIFAVCEEVAPDATDPSKLSLLRLVEAIRPKPGSQYPLLQPVLTAFAQLTGGRGSGTVRAEVRNADTDAVIRRTRSATAAFPTNDPLTVRGVTIRIPNVVFDAPGLYWVELWYDDEVLAQAPVLLRPEQPSHE